MSIRSWFTELFEAGQGEGEPARDRRAFLRGAGVASLVCALPATAVAAAVTTTAPVAPEPARPTKRRHWGMAIDLDRCAACSSCNVACKQENNVPSFGADPTFHGARPEWMSTLWQESERPGGMPELLPLPCMHCADPPCVKVCPVGATYKDPDGITMQVWDRCIGCRYCMVACPYARRSFNWSEPTWTPSEQQMLNPDVATRPAGVVEKCTFCHHRVRALSEQARLEGREIRDDEVEHLPACAAACPAHAITFGDLEDAHSHVSRLAASPRAYRLLEHLGTDPSVYYLKKERG